MNLNPGEMFTGDCVASAKETCRLVGTGTQIGSSALCFFNLLIMLANADEENEEESNSGDEEQNDQVQLGRAQGP